MSNRKLFVWFMLLALLIPVALTACGGSGNIEQAVEEAAQQVQEAAPTVQAAVEEVAPTVQAAVEEAVQAEPTAEPAAEEPTAEPVVEEPVAEPDYDTEIYGNLSEIDLDGAHVIFWTRYDSGGRQEVMNEICADFNATNEYGITVECLPIGHYGVLYDNMIAALATGEVPGLIVAYQNQAAAYEVADGLVAIDPYINDPTYGLSEEDKADFFPSFIASDRLPQFGGQDFGFPAAGRSMEVVYYNMDWLTELGYDAPPQTPEQFAEMACAASAQPFSKNASDFSVGMELSTDASRFAALVFARGGDIFDYDNGVFTLNTPEAVDAMTTMQDLFNQGCIAPIAERYGDQADFGNGMNLFTQGSSSGLPYYASAVNDGGTGGFEWSVVPIPYTGDNPVQNIYGASTSIVKTDPQTQLASWLFLKFWASAENQAKWVPASNYFPSRASVAADLSDYMQENVAFGTAFDLLQYGKAEAPVAGYDNIRDVMSETFADIVFNGADAASSLDALNEQANAIMEESAP